MPDDPIISFGITILTDERGSALRGEAVITQNGVAIHHERLDADSKGTHIAGACCDLLSACKAALDALSATKPDEDPPPTQPKSRPRRQAKSNTSTSPGVSMSRRR